MENWNNPLTEAEEQSMHPDSRAIFRHFKFERLPVEGTFFKNTYRSNQRTSTGNPSGTAIIGMYCNQPLSISCFHCLTHDEVWHVYGGDPFKLVLLHPDGSSEDVLMGSNALNGEKIQFVVPAHSWQAGYLLPGGRYALYGCTMAPGFIGADFEAATADELIALYPERADEILRLSVKGHETRLPDGYEQ